MLIERRIGGVLEFACRLCEVGVCRRSIFYQMKLIPRRESDNCTYNTFQSIDHIDQSSARNIPLRFHTLSMKKISILSVLVTTVTLSRVVCLWEN